MALLTSIKEVLQIGPETPSAIDIIHPNIETTGLSLTLILQVINYSRYKSEHRFQPKVAGSFRINGDIYSSTGVKLDSVWWDSPITILPATFEWIELYPDDLSSTGYSPEKHLGTIFEVSAILTSNTTRVKLTTLEPSFIWEGIDTEERFSMITVGINVKEIE